MNTTTAPNQSKVPTSTANKPLLLTVLICFVAILSTTIYYLRKMPPPVGVAVMTWGGAGPGFVAAKKGFFGELKVTLRIIDDTKSRQAAYHSDDFEVYLTNPDQHPKERKLGLPGTMFMLSDFSYGADGLVTDNSIAKIADLRGKRIAFTQGTASDFMLAKALMQAGLSRQDVQLVEFDDPANGMAALSSRRVDAAVSWEPLMTQATKTEPVHILFSSKDVPGTIIGVFIAKNSLLQDENRLRMFFDGWQKGVEYIKSNPKDAMKIMAEAFAVTEADMAGMMDGLQLADVKANLEYFKPSENGSTKIDDFTNDAADYWRSIGLLSEGRRKSQPWTTGEVRDFYRKLTQP